MPIIESDSQFVRVECPVCNSNGRPALLFKIETATEVLYTKPAIEIQQAAIVIEIKCQRCDRLIWLTIKLPVEFIEPSPIDLG